MKLGRRIFKARKARGYTQAALAKKMHISRVTMSRIENDKTEVTEDFLRELHSVLTGRTGPAYPVGGGSFGYFPAPGRFEHRVAEEYYPCRNCDYNSANLGLEEGEEHCRFCPYNRRKVTHLAAGGLIK